eukprot:6717268-Alexandrium_andersonii.AAC.1
MCIRDSVLRPSCSGTKAAPKRALSSTSGIKKSNGDSPRLRSARAARRSPGPGRPQEQAPRPAAEIALP